MKELLPYISIIVFVLGLIVSFCVWLVKQNNKKDTIIAELKAEISLKFNNMEQKIKSLEEKDKEREKESDWLRNKLSELSEMLAVAKNTIDLLILKNLKTNKTA